MKSNPSSPIKINKPVINLEKQNKMKWTVDMNLYSYCKTWCNIMSSGHLVGWGDLNQWTEHNWVVDMMVNLVVDSSCRHPMRIKIVYLNMVYQWNIRHLLQCQGCRNHDVRIPGCVKEWQTSLLGETHRNRFTQQSKTHFEREREKQYVTSHLKFITIPTVSPNKIKHRQS